MTSIQANVDAALLRLDLDQLDPTESAALHLIYGQNQTHREVSAALSMSEPETATLVARAMSRLADVICHGI